MMTGLRDRVASQLARYPTRELLRWYAFYRSRVHVISYPKSGRTWLRFALGVALQEHFGLDVDDRADLLEITRLARIDRRIPSIRFSHDDDPHKKTVTELERSKRAYRSRHVLLLVRDPRDIVVSSYHQHTRRSSGTDDPSFSGSISEFVRDPALGIDTIIEFLNIWADNRTVPRRFTLLRYEDMLDDFERELCRALAFAGLPAVRDHAIRRAVEVTSFEQMRALERQDALGTDRLRSADTDDPNAYKVRKGKVGGFVDELQPSDRDYVNASMTTLDPYFGYVV